MLIQIRTLLQRYRSHTAFGLGTTGRRAFGLGMGRRAFGLGMGRRAFGLGLTGSVLLVSGMAWGSAADVRLRLAGVTRLFEQQAPRSHGAAAMVVMDRGEVIYRSTAGMQKNNSGPIDADTTLFSSASVAKPISAAMVASLVKQGKLSFDEPLATAFPTLPPTVTLRHALSHSSGLQAAGSNGAIERGLSRDQIVQQVLKAKPFAQPGQRYKYSNIVFSLLEDVLREKARVPYPLAMQAFFQQIGATQAQACGVQGSQSVAYPHIVTKSGKHMAKHLPERYPATSCSASGLFLTLSDVTAFMRLMMGERPEVLGPAELEALLSPQIEASEIFRTWGVRWPFPWRELASSYTLGWRLFRHQKNPTHPLYFHSGYLDGVRTFVGLIPSKGLSYAILMSRDNLIPIELGLELWRQAIGEPAAPRAAKKISKQKRN